MAHPTISIIIPTYNRDNLLRCTLNSIMEQSIPRDAYEVIVVNDGGCYKSTQSLIIDNFPELTIKHLYQEDKGYRVAKARNLGVMAAESEYILFIDSGILLHSIALSRHIQFHRNVSKGLLLGYIYGFENENAYKLSDFSSVSEICNIAIKEQITDTRQKQYDLLGENLQNWPAPFDIFWAGHVSMEKSEFVSAGMFDESYITWGGEDQDLGIRLFLRNNVFVLDKLAISVHLPHDDHQEKISLDNKCKFHDFHKKYQLWQTRYYTLFDDVPHDISLNAAISMFPINNIKSYRDMSDSEKYNLKS